MRKFYLSIFSITSIILFAVVLFIINSCKKDVKSTTTVPIPADVLKAKTWYESTYPVYTTNTLNNGKTTQSIDTANSDYSQFIKPDWQHTASYVRFNEKVIEMPIDSPAFKGFALKGAELSQFSYNKAYSRAYFLMMNDGKTYSAYIMVIMADSAYVNNDLSKLNNNTYRKHDADFSGMVLYFTPKGVYSGGYLYKNGQLVTAPSDSQNTEITNNKKTTDDTTLPISGQTVCIAWFLDTYVNEVLVNSVYLYTTCYGGGGGSGGTSGSSGGTGSPPPPAPPCKTGTSTGTGYNVGVNSSTAPIGGAPPPSGGGFPPPTTTTTTTPCTIPDDGFKVIFCAGLTSTEQASIQSTITAFSTEDCASKFLYNFFSDQTFSFCIGAGAGDSNAYFSAANNSITFSSDIAATPAYADLLEHEFFHAYQNATYPGGTSAYGQNATTGIKSAGYVNIEFEQAVFNDISTNRRQAFEDGSPAQQEQYNTWLNGLTADGTVYPQLSPSSPGYTQFINTYNSFLSQFNDLPGNPYNSDIISLAPQALINLFNVVTPNC
jgi:hypothetical protein